MLYSDYDQKKYTVFSSIQYVIMLSTAILNLVVDTHNRDGISDSSCQLAFLGYQPKLSKAISAIIDLNPGIDEGH